MISVRVRGLGKWRGRKLLLATCLSTRGTASKTMREGRRLKRITLLRKKMVSE